MRIYRKPYRIKKRKSIFGNRFFWLTILIFLIFGAIFYLIFFHSFFQVKEIQISGNQKVSVKDLENLIKEKINQKILFFLTKSIFLANFGEMEKEILKNFPQIEKANLKRKFPNILLLKVEERKPIATFCPIHSDLKCFFIDKEGIIFELTEKKSELMIIKKETAKELNLGEKIIEKEELSKILEVEEKLKNELKILIKEVLIIPEERFNTKTSEGWQIYFSFKENLDWQLIKLNAVLEKEIPLEKRKDLEYIDVRFGNFAPYKYRH